MRNWLSALGALLVLPVVVSAQTEALRWNGELRLRHEAERPAPVDTFDAFTYARARLGLEAVLSADARVYLQVQDARVFGEEASTLEGSADRLDLHQGYLEFKRTLAGADLLVRAGRQEIALGNERLIGAVGWSNTGRSFDALRVDAGQVSAFAATVRERGRRNAAASADREDHVLLGGYVDLAQVDGWLLFDRSDAYRGFTGADRLTIGGRVDLPKLGVLRAWGEGSYQLGSQLRTSPAQEQDIGAYLLGGRAALEVGHDVLRTISAGVDYVSGDDDPADDEYASFNMLQYTGHKWFGFIDLFTDPAARTGDRGLVDFVGSVAVKSLTLDAHVFRTAVQRTDAEENGIGWELDATLPVSLGTGQRLQLGYSLFRNGGAAPMLGLGDDGATWHWGYAMLTFAFGAR